MYQRSEPQMCDTNTGRIEGRKELLGKMPVCAAGGPVHPPSWSLHHMMWASPVFCSSLLFVTLCEHGKLLTSAEGHALIVTFLAVFLQRWSQETERMVQMWP